MITIDPTLFGDLAPSEPKLQIRNMKTNQSTLKSAGDALCDFALAGNVAMLERVNQEYLLAVDRLFGRNFLMCACMRKRANVIEWYLKRFPPGHRSLLHACDDYGDNCVNLAVGKADENDNQCLRMLVEAGVDVSSANAQGVTSLHMAAIAGHEAAARYLLTRADCDLETPDTAGNTPVQNARLNKHETIARLIENEVW
jgi:hypothetical protein